MDTQSTSAAAAPSTSAPATTKAPSKVVTTSKRITITKKSTKSNKHPFKPTPKPTPKKVLRSKTPTTPTPKGLLVTGLGGNLPIRYPEVSATDPDCGVNAMVSYALGYDSGKLREFEVKHDTGEVCITASLDYETRNLYDFPVIATDRGGLSTTARIKIQLTDINDNRPIFYPREYNVSLKEGAASTPTTASVVRVAATDPDSERFGSLTYQIVAGNDGDLYRIDRKSGEIFVNRPNQLSTRSQPHKLTISATDGGGLKSKEDAEIFISVIDAGKKPPIFESAHYTYSVRENVTANTIVGYVKATVTDPGARHSIRYSIYSGDPDGFFWIDAVNGTIRTATKLDHEKRASVLLNVQAKSGDPPIYAHTQVNIEIEDVNDNHPEFESTIVRISVPENMKTRSPLYQICAKDKDSGANSEIIYKIQNKAAVGDLFEVNPETGHLILIRQLDYETKPNHTLNITATDKGDHPLSANLIVIVEVQDINDNPPMFEKPEYTIEVLETLDINDKILQVRATDKDTGNNARLTYRMTSSNATSSPVTIANSKYESEVFGVYPDTGWLYLRGTLDREIRDNYNLTIAATDNGTPSQSALTRVVVKVLDANDNDPIFTKESYEFTVEENMERGTSVGSVSATDADIGSNAAIKYSIIPSNTSFQIDPITGEIITTKPLDREQKESYELVIEARDQGTPSRNSRISASIIVLDVNDNSPEIIDPQGNVVNVREEQPIETDVVRVKAIDADKGENSTISYSILKDRDTIGYDIFNIDPVSGIIRTKKTLNHEEGRMYILAVAATDNGNPPRQTVRILRVDVLDLDDNQTIFTSSSLIFRVPEDVAIGHVVGSITTSGTHEQKSFSTESTDGGHITYTLNSPKPEPFDIDRNTGYLVVIRKLDREQQAMYQFEIEASDTSAMPQSSSVKIQVDIADVNDNAPEWPEDPLIIPLPENTLVGTSIYNFKAKDNDSGHNGNLRYSLVRQYPNSSTFNVDSLTGTLTLLSPLDFETLQEYTIIVKATDQSLNISEQLSSSVTARITITDTNDNSPKFVVPSGGTVFFSDSVTVGMLITHVVAVDSDSGDNGRISYGITGGNEDRLFALGYDTGVLTLAKPISLTENKIFTINITASDHGIPTKYAYTTLKLSVQSSSENPPKFLNSIYYASITEDAPIGSFIVTVEARSTHNPEEGNLTFTIPQGIADDSFTINPVTGRVESNRRLDREEVENYIIPIYVTDFDYHDGTGRSQFDIATLNITITDVNDHEPEFKVRNFTLALPENNEAGIVHTVVATDLDSGKNSEVLYRITSGNIGNKFSIDTKTGELTASPLDRESRSRYRLTIMAQDRGNPPKQGFCNISIFVLDQNDNDPKFDSPNYSTGIVEDVAVDTFVLKVIAKDPDEGVNGDIIYSLANESPWLFRIDNKTGVIYTAGLFDRERRTTYDFVVIATDNGKYNIRSQKVSVRVQILDANDNRPIFTKYPFKEKVTAYIQPGKGILTVSAEDADQGTNADIIYRLVSGQYSDIFRVDPNNGMLSASQSLVSHNGKILHLNVIATDKGNPPQSSTGLVEIYVGDTSDEGPKLRFQNNSYRVTLMENANPFDNITYVRALRTDGRKQKIYYSFRSGNEENIFFINPDTGLIQVQDSKYLDYEIHKELRLVIEAKTESNPILYGYCEIIVELTDRNDNVPIFSQQQYTSSVSEGSNKNAHVLQVFAFDADEGQNSRILYHIVDGNHDNAFKIEPAFSGKLKTNIVLDREIRDIYRLTIIATDEGVPQMTGTARIHINVIDVNDNQPTFPPHSITKVSEATAAGTVLATITANDVDTNPPLTYSFSAGNDKETIKNFSIDKYNGKVILKKSLDFEDRQEYRLKITASDTIHSAQTTLTIRVTDVNDNRPTFTENVYFTTIPDGHSTNFIDILTVNASDRDSGDNSLIKFSILTPTPGFSIDETSGTLRVNQSNISSIAQDFEITIKATDSGIPPLYSLTSVRIKANGGFGVNSKKNDRKYQIQIPEDTSKGATILDLSQSVQNKYMYNIMEGNEDNVFEIANPNGIIVLIKDLDREHRDVYNLKLSNGDSAYSSNYSAIDVHVAVEDVNDNSPVFRENNYECTISENVPVGTSITELVAIDADMQDTPNSEVVYDITSGNDNFLFNINEQSGVLSVNNSLDYDNGQIMHNLVVRACDRGQTPLCTLTTCLVTLEDANDNAPQFGVQEYLEFVAESQAVGTSVFTAHATDLDGPVFGKLNYTIQGYSSGYSIDDSSELFRIDKTTGVVVTNSVFDYERRNRYVFVIKASDIDGKTATVTVRVEIESRDEFTPHFTENNYTFVLPTSPSGSLPVGTIIGNVTATDRDKGPDGRVIYQLSHQHPYFKINRTTGTIMVKHKFDYAQLLGPDQDSFVVRASSGRQNSRKNSAVVQIVVNPLGDPSTNLAINRDGKTTVVSGGIADWALGLLISLILLLITFGAVFVFLHMKNKRNKKINKPTLSSESVSTSNNYVDPSAFDTIPIRGSGGGVIAGGNNQFAPPKYDEIPPYGSGHAASSNSGAATTSELSGSEQSGSSGRGSAEEGEDGEDEEIRMINEGPLQRDSGIHRQNDDDEDNLSDVSVRNTQEYLARLGIVNNGSTGMPQSTGRLCSDPRAGSSKESLHHHQTVPLDSLHMFDEDGNAENISNFYAKLNDVAGSDRASSTDEGGGVNATTLGSTMDHVMAMSGYGDVPAVTHQPSMNGSLSSIVHSEEELAGSYNWDYLLDWGPQYQPLAHVFSEIARLKDDTASVQSAASGNSSVKSKSSVAPAKNIPPPLITNVAPRSIAMPVLNARGGSSHHVTNNHNQILMLPRSPINHDASGATFSTSAAMSPSFSPSLSPLATKSPSISPLVTPGLSTAHHMMPRQPPQPRTKTVVDTELRL